MRATMMHTPMTVQLIMQHGAQVFPRSRIGVFDGGEVHYSSYAEVAANATRLASGLASLGIRPGDRVGTFSWNNTAHMEAYLAIPAMGAIMHTVNIRLAPEQVAYVINHAEDRALLLDASLLELFVPVLPLLRTVEHIILVGGDPEQLPGNIARCDYGGLLAESGFDPRRLRLEWIAPDDPRDFVGKITDFTNLVQALGPGSVQRI